MHMCMGQPNTVDHSDIENLSKLSIIDIFESIFTRSPVLTQLSKLFITKKSLKRSFKSRIAIHFEWTELLLTIQQPNSFQEGRFTGKASIWMRTKGTQLAHTRRPTMFNTIISTITLGTNCVNSSLILKNFRSRKSEPGKIDAMYLIELLKLLRT